MQQMGVYPRGVARRGFTAAIEIRILTGEVKFNVANLYVKVTS